MNLYLVQFFCFTLLLLLQDSVILCGESHFSRDCVIQGFLLFSLSCLVARVSGRRFCSCIVKFQVSFCVQRACKTKGGRSRDIRKGADKRGEALGDFGVLASKKVHEFCTCMILVGLPVQSTILVLSLQDF